MAANKKSPSAMQTGILKYGFSLSLCLSSSVTHTLFNTSAFAFKAA